MTPDQGAPHRPFSLRRLLLGRSLATFEQSEHKIGSIAGLPAVGLDGIASSAYGPEAALAVLASLGAVGLYYAGPVMLLILILLAALYFSYRQTIAAYPTGGGAFTVAKENLGPTAALTAAAALMVDYTLNVAVGISAGVGALVSAVPALHPYILPLCLVILVFITLVNLRGTLESGWAFALPTYLFVFGFLAVLLVGVWRALRSDGAPPPVVPPPPLQVSSAAAASLWLLARSFASGCTAMTGVEAVSNSMTAFRDPPVRHARRTLTLIVVILASMLGGIAYLAPAYGVGAMNQAQPGYQSVISQIVAAVTGRGAVFYTVIGSLLAVLCLSANTSFVGFPRLCRVIAADSYLPHAFTIVGRRLVYTIGILFLTVSAGALLIVFEGITDRLIPLFAVGAFLAFTLSQAGMVAHWIRALRQGRREDSPRARRVHAVIGLAVNGLGAAVTAAALLVIIVAKFIHGAWITLVSIPGLIALFRVVRFHYDSVAEQVRPPGPLNLRRAARPVVVIATESWNKLTDKSLRFGMHLSDTILCVHITDFEDCADEERAAALRSQWEHDVAAPARRAGFPEPRLVLLYSPYRKFIDPLLAFVDRLEQAQHWRPVAIVIPEFVKRRWWQYILHDYRAERLRAVLLKRGYRRVIVITVPWYLDDRPDPAELAEPPADEAIALDITDIPVEQVTEVAARRVRSAEDRRGS